MSIDLLLNDVYGVVSSNSKLGNPIIVQKYNFDKISSFLRSIKDKLKERILNVEFKAVCIWFYDSNPQV